MPLFFQSGKKYRYFFVMQSQIQCASFSKMTQMKLENFLSWKLNVAKLGMAVMQTFKFLELENCWNLNVSCCTEKCWQTFKFLKFEIVGI